MMDWNDAVVYHIDKSPLRIARTASAAWKAKAKDLLAAYYELRILYYDMITCRNMERTRAEAAEKRVQEMESNINAANERASRWEAAWEDVWDYAERKIKQALLFYDKYRQEKKRVAQLLEACEAIIDCPYVIDQASVPKAGIDAAPPYQVVGTMSMAVTKYRKLNAAIAAAKEKER